MKTVVACAALHLCIPRGGNYDCWSHRPQLKRVTYFVFFKTQTDNPPPPSPPGYISAPLFTRLQAPGQPQGNEVVAPLCTHQQPVTYSFLLSAKITVSVFCCHLFDPSPIFFGGKPQLNL